METYLNVVEMGPGVYGAEAAARHYFGVDAAHLSADEAARLAAIFPDPLKWQAVDPGPYVRRRSRRIGGALMTVRSVGLAACVGRLSGAAAAGPPAPYAPPPEAAKAWLRQRAASEPDLPARPLAPPPEEPGAQSSAAASAPDDLAPDAAPAPSVRPSGQTPAQAPAPAQPQP